MRPTVFIPNFNGADRIGRSLGGLRRQTREVDVVVVDNGSVDDSAEMIRTKFPEVELIVMSENRGFGPALNAGVAATPDADPLILLNDDADPEPAFIAALLDATGDDIAMVAGVMTQERSPALIDSAGVVADRTLMGFDYLHGEPVASAETAADPLGPTGGAGLYRRAAFDAVEGFDDRIFLYYEDLDLALRLAAGGGRCRLAPEARALHSYSTSLGAASGAKYARTGWSRGYMLRRYGVMNDPRIALRALACEGTICIGQLLRDHTLRGLSGRLRGYYDGGGSEPRDPGAAPLLEISARQALALRRLRRGD
ncbi:MAG: glycosyltransferase family 2 protein [Actinobacteria bacterium]|nr:glycosyltransferase family 2 protein [Actinomycetota bacterium]